jgi:hypothetical protein
MKASRRTFVLAAGAAPAVLTAWSQGDGPARPPREAKMLFNGADLSGWHALDMGPARWKVAGGTMQVVPGAGHIVSRELLLDHQLHIEFSTPYMPQAKGQARANSGVYIQGRYELQVLDSYGLDPRDDDCGAIYKIAAPLRNACRKPEEWQTYDIAFRAPRFDPSGTEIEKGRVTVFQNGILIQNNLELSRATGGGWDSNVGAPGPLLLQDHGSLVRYRNIWTLPN